MHAGPVAFSATVQFCWHMSRFAWFATSVLADVYINLSSLWMAEEKIYLPFVVQCGQTVWRVQ
jgi:hypothetical protein